MVEIEIPSGVRVSVDVPAGSITVSGKAGSSIKAVNSKYLDVAVEGGKIIIRPNGNKKLAKKAALVENTLLKVLSKSLKSVEDGIVVKMSIVYAHFPMSIEIKGNRMLIKNIFGGKISREAGIVGDTKAVVKGQEVIISGADLYDTGQTVANIMKACHARGYDSRLFHDGIYRIAEE